MYLAMDRGLVGQSCSSDHALEATASSFEQILENPGVENQPSKRTRFSFENLGRIL